MNDDLLPLKKRKLENDQYLLIAQIITKQSDGFCFTKTMMLLTTKNRIWNDLLEEKETPKKYVIHDIWEDLYDEDFDEWFSSSMEADEWFSQEKFQKFESPRCFIGTIFFQVWEKNYVTDDSDENIEEW